MYSRIGLSCLQVLLLYICLSSTSPVQSKKESFPRKILFEKSEPSYNRDDVTDLNHIRNLQLPTKSMQKNESFGAVGNLECTTCRSLLSLALWKFRTENYTYPGLPEFIDSACKRLHIEENRVCDGLINIFKTEVLTLLTELKLSAKDVCGLVLPTTCYSPTLSWNKIKWNVVLPKKHELKPADTKLFQRDVNLKPLRVLQLTDAHVDFLYKPGGIVNCDEPLCCRKISKLSKKANSAKAAGYWGTLGYCDTPYWTFENLLEYASKKEKYDYIMWTGDLPAHNDWNQSKEAQISIIKNTTAALLKYFPYTPIFPALGNHESSPVNSFPPEYVKGNHTISWLYEAIRKSWSNWLPNDALDTVSKYGYYTVLRKPNLRIISLNMNYCNQQNWWMLINPVDPDNELKWLVSVLQKAEDKGENVHIIGHIPPGYGPDCLKIWSNNYYTIVDRYHEIIKGQFFGHTHVDELEIFYDVKTLKSPINMAYVGPSITTYDNMNPGYRVYDVDSLTYELNDIETYILNLTKANSKHEKPIWDLEYTAKKTYNLTDLSPNSWDNLLRSWIEYKDPNAVQTFQKYYQYFYKSNPPSAECEKSCRKEMLCRMRSGKSDDSSELCKNIV